MTIHKSNFVNWTYLGRLILTEMLVNLDDKFFWPVGWAKNARDETFRHCLQGALIAQWVKHWLAKLAVQALRL